MTGDAGKCDQRILAAKRIQIAAAEADHADLQQQVFYGLCRLGDGLNCRLAWILNNQSLQNFSAQCLEICFEPKLYTIQLSLTIVNSNSECAETR